MNIQYQSRIKKLKVLSVIVVILTLLSGCLAQEKENENKTINNSGSIDDNISNYEDKLLPIISQNFIHNDSIPDNIFLANPLPPFDNEGQSISYSSIKKGIEWRLKYPTNGGLYIGQLYPIGKTTYHINMSIERDSGSPNLYIGNKDSLFYIGLIRYSGYYRINLYYYDTDGKLQYDKYIDIDKNYANFYIEWSPNGTVRIYDQKNSVSGISHLDWAYPYNYISPTLLSFSVWMSKANVVKIYFYEFEQLIPNDIVTVIPDNKLFPFGFDYRPGLLNGTDWLLMHGQRSTIWIDLDNFGRWTDEEKNILYKLIRNERFELGIHFTRRLTDLPIQESFNFMTQEVEKLYSLFDSYPLSWNSLQNADNSKHADYMWQKYRILWRNSPQSYHLVPRVGNLGTNTKKWWFNASSHGTFIPSFTHDVESNPDDFSISDKDFHLIMSNYLNRGIKIIPYAEWYQINSINVLDINFSISNASFKVNTNGHRIIVKIDDPYDHNNEGVWVSDMGSLKKISSVPIKLEIISNETITVRRINKKVSD